MCVGMSVHDVIICSIDDLLALTLVLETSDGLVEVGEVVLKRDIMLVRDQYVIEPPPKHDLAGPCPDRVEVS